MAEDETDEVRRSLLRRARNILTVAAASAGGISLNHTGEASQLNEIAENLGKDHPDMLNPYKASLQSTAEAVQDGVGKPTFTAAVAGSAAALAASKIDKGSQVPANSAEGISRRNAIRTASALALAAGSAGVVYNLGRGQGIRDAGEQVPSYITEEEKLALVPVIQEAGKKDVMQMTASGTLGAASAVILGNHLANEVNRAAKKNNSENER